MLNAIFRSLFSGRADPASAAASAIYEQIVAQARQPAFYAEHGVPDTPTGRFEMIVAHAALVFRRLRGDEAQSRVAQAVFDLFFADMDRSLRELGVGDLSVPKKIKGMGQVFYGRALAYAEALDAQDAGALGAALAGNLLAGSRDERRERDAAAIARYMLCADAALAAAATDDIYGGTLPWPSADDFGDGDHDR